MLCLFFLTPEQARSHLCHVRSVCSSHLVCATHLADKRGALEQARPNLRHVGSVCSSHLGGTTLGQTWHPRASTTHFLPSTFCLFFLHLCHVFSVCSSHLVCATHFADKRGPLEQARTSLYHVCETGGVCWQLTRFWKLASDKSFGERLKICSLQLAVNKALGVGERNKSHL